MTVKLPCPFCGEELEIEIRPPIEKRWTWRTRLRLALLAAALLAAAGACWWWVAR